MTYDDIRKLIPSISINGPFIDDLDLFEAEDLEEIDYEFDDPNNDFNNYINYLNELPQNRRYWKKLRREMKSYDRRQEYLYIILRKRVFRRDNYTCRCCGIKNNLQAHHIKQVIFYPELIYNIDNGITLCYDCHKDIPILRKNKGRGIK